MVQDPESARLEEARNTKAPWRQWGPYLSERQWGTVREDYSKNGDAWNYFTHDQARSRAYHWGEDGLAGFSDDHQRLCFAVALWNGKDPILKERLFGLTNSESNHGEDVKEYYFYLDSTPTHSYMRFLYKYPQAAFPYGRLVHENRRRAGQGFEFELLDTGVFDEDRYFDIVIEYAKINPEDICMRIEASNCGPEAAPLHIFPHLWFRNIWSWRGQPEPEPIIQLGPDGPNHMRLVADDAKLSIPCAIPVRYRLGPRTLYAPPSDSPLFTDNETNKPRVFGPSHGSRKPYVKDAFHRWIIHGEP